MVKIYAKSPHQSAPISASVRGLLWHALIRRKVLVFSFLFLLVTLPILYLVIKYQSPIQAAWFDDTFAYRQTVAITNAGTAQTDFQVAITLNTSALVTAGKMQSDCDDIRITDINGKILPHWIEESNPGCNQTTTKIWTKAPSITTSGATVYLYYGNPSALNVENPTQVFVFYDNFSSDLSRWTIPAGCVSAITSGVLQITASAGGCDATPMYITSLTQSDVSGYAMDFRGKFSSGGNGRLQTYQRYRSINTHMARFWISGTVTYYQEATPGFGTNTNVGNSNMSADTWYNLSAKVAGTNNTWIVNGTTIGSNVTTAATLLTQTDLTVGLGQYGTTVQYDNVRVRKSAATEPSVGSPTNEEKSAGPVAYWKFDEGYGTSTNDSTSNANTGTLGAGTASYRPTWQSEDQCISGKCLYFDGTDDYITSANSIAIGTSDFTVQAWVKSQDTSAKAIIGTVSGGGQTGFLLYTNYSGSTAYFATWGGANPSVSAITQTNNDGKWHHIVGVRSGTTLSIYIDGKLDNSTTATVVDLGSSSIAPRIGAMRINPPSDTQHPFKGFVDDVKIYPYARTAAQVKTDFAKASSVKGTAASLGSSSKNSDAFSNGLVGYWKMDEAAANSCTGGVNDSCDSSGNGNDGAWNGDATSTAGKFGNGVTFDGTGDYINAGNSSTLTSNTTWTASVWVNPTSVSGYHAVIGGGYTATNATVYIRDGKVGVFTNGDYLTTDTISTSTWSHITVTEDGTSLRIYINDALSRTFTNTFSFGPGTVNMTIGINPHTLNTEGFVGKIDDVRIYNRALSGKEVRDLYAFAPGPVGYWNMDEGAGTNLNDRSGNGLTSSSFGGSPTWSNGKFGKALSFDGVDDRVLIPDNALLDMGYKDFSISAWAKISTDTNNYGDIAGKGSSGWNGAYTYGLVNNNTCVYGYMTRNGTGDRILTSCYTYVPDTWYHYSVVFDRDGNMTLYVNGNASSSVSINSYVSENFDNSGSVQIGEYGGWYMKGAVDDVRIYNYARTSKQIVEDMNAGHPAPGSPVGSQVGYWKMDEGYGTTNAVHDSSIQNNNGTWEGTGTSHWSNAGKFGKAGSFNGSDDDINFGDPTNGSLDVGSGSHTISFWVKRNNANSHAIVSKRSGGVGYEIYLTHSNTINYFHGDTTGFDNVLSVAHSALAANTWTYVAAVYNSIDAKVYYYVNGVKFDSDTISYTGSLDNAGNLYLGREINPSANRLNGVIDEVKIYNSALTEDEIKLDYNHGSAMVLGKISTDSDGSTPSDADSRGYCIPGDTASCNSPVAEWKFDEGTGNNIYDVSGNGYSGTWNGSSNHWITGKFGKAGNFLTANSDYVNLGTTASLTPTSLVTAEVWVYLTRFPTQASERMGILGRNYRHPWQIGLWESGQIYWGYTMSNGTDFDYVAIGSPLTLNRWNFIAITHNVSTGQITAQINGVKSSSTATYTGTLETPSSTATIGSSGTGAQYFEGKIDQARIFNYVRTPAQVAYDYNRGGPVGWWKMDECQGVVAHDSAAALSGAGNNGTITIGATGSQTSPGTCTDGFSTSAWYNGRTGKYNSSLNFDGVDDYVDNISDSSYRFSSGDFTLSSWIKQTSGLTIIGKGADCSASGSEYVWQVNGSGFYFRGAWRTSSALNISTGTWINQTIVFTDSDDVIKIYNNGVLAGTITGVTGTYATSTGYLRIAKQQTCGNYFNGQIDDVRIFNYALTGTQVKTLFNENSAIRFGPSSGSP